MKTARTLVGFLVGLVALGGARAPACSVVLRTPLWEAIGQAEVIVLARVEAFEGADGPSGPGNAGSEFDVFESDVAVLKILETWKGSPRGAVRVNFSETFSLDGRRVAVGDRILVFLESGEAQVRRRHEAEMAPVEEPAVEEPSAEWFSEEEESGADFEAAAAEELVRMREFNRRWEEHRIGRWFVSGDGSGFLVPESADVEPLRNLVDQAVRLQQGSPVLDDVRREWLVQAALLRETRRDALQDLQVLLAASESGGEGSDSPTNRLSESEQRTIAESFVRDRVADAAVPTLMSLLSGFEDENLDRALVSVIEAGVAAPRIPWWVPEAIRHLVARRGWRDWGPEIWHLDVAAGTLKEIWPAVARDLNLPSVPPAILQTDE